MSSNKIVTVTTTEGTRYRGRVERRTAFGITLREGWKVSRKGEAFASTFHSGHTVVSVPVTGIASVV